ncbi:hypothetical protein [Microbacterium sp.]|uniref:Tc toxin subunit A-related protein n=1 Tax=Microbacterium sp. TaxID=51671 RepID=UPI003C16EA66
MAGSIKHAANFITTLDSRALQYADLTVNPANTAASAVERIRTILREAASAADRGRHSAALRSYRDAQASCYALLNPAVAPGRGWMDYRVTLPLGVAVESAFSSASVKLIEALRPDVTAPVAPIAARPIGAQIDTAVAGLGFRRQNADLVTDIESGTQLIAKGDAAAAIPFLERAAAGLTDDQPALQAVALLNLSTALIGVGTNDAAADAAFRAATAFTAAGDDAGVAQALHASGLAAQRSGDAATAEAKFAEAKEKLALFTGVAPAVVDAEPIVVAPILRRRFGRQDGIGRFGVGGPAFSNVREAAFGVDLPVARAAVPVREFLPGAEGVTDVSGLAFIDAATTTVASLRWVDSESIVSLPIDQLAQPITRRDTWSVGIPAGDGIADLVWKKDGPAPLDDLVAKVYEPRKDIRIIRDLVPPMSSAAVTTAYLTHVYSFVIPMGIADAYHSLGDYARAEENYLAAAGYSYLNPELEAPSLWVKLARNVLDWGDSLYKFERVDEARAIYAKVALADGTPDAAAPLYATPSLAATGDVAKLVLATPDAVPVDVNPAVAEIALTVLARWAYITGGLDFFGLTFTPTFTFEYLQQVAKGLAQQSVQAEREYVNFTVQAEAESAARRDLESSLALADTEVKTQSALAQAAQADALAAARSVDFATLRRDNAADSRAEYASAGYWQYISQSIATAHGAGKDWHESEIRGLAQQIESGKWSGEGGKLAAAATLIGGQKSYEYQLSRLEDQKQEAAAAIPIAQAQQAASQARAQAAAFQAQASQQRRALLADALNAFDDEVFTPELWTRMAAIVRDIARTYQHWAIAAAKLMERAYNFETDEAIAVIRPEYSVPATGDLLGSDLLVRDIDSFTYHLISAVAKKQSSVKEVVSLRNEYPFAFREFLEHGVLSFDTSLYDFDRRHPGTYGQRLQSVEVEIVGLLPTGGVRGTLRGGGVSHYRTADADQRTRVHGIDTMVLSDYTMRGDSYLFRGDAIHLGLFEGHGVATSWELELPPGSNNLDYRLISDVQLVLYYTARHSDTLRDSIVALPLRDGEDIHVRDFALRYDFPEVWYGMLQTGGMTWQMDADSFPRNETGLHTASLAIVLEGADTVDLSGIAVTIDLPGEGPVTLTTNAEGTIAAEGGNDLADAMGGDVFGEWSLTLAPPAGSPVLTASGGLDPKMLRGASVVLQYTFELRK